MRKIFRFLSIIIAFSFSDISLRKRISDANFRYEFYTTNKTVTSKPGRQYYWFKGGTIHNSEYGTAGALLEGNYDKFYHTNQLAEKGVFNNGLKTGYWKNWYSDGTLASYVYWSSGQMDGDYIIYDKLGNILEQGKYRDNKKHGQWINYTKKDTLKYNKGELVLPKIITTKPKDSKPGFFSRLFNKTKKDSLNNKREKITLPKKSKDSNKPAKVKKEKQENFFTRLFKKKQQAKK